MRGISATLTSTENYNPLSSSCLLPLQRSWRFLTLTISCFVAIASRNFRQYKPIILITIMVSNKLQWYYGRISALDPEDHCRLTIAVPKELGYVYSCRLLHVDGKWSSTRGKGVKLMWTEGGVVKNRLLVDVINFWPLLWQERVHWGVEPRKAETP